MFPRRFLEFDLQQNSSAEQRALAFPADVRLAAWSPDDYQASAELILLAYSGHVDARVNDQYRSLHGSLRFLHNIVRFPGCGVFDAEASWVLRDRSTGALAAIVLCSNVGDNVAHVTQLCVSPEHRGRGVAKLLLQHCAAHLFRRGFQAITLTVTEANLAAMKLYSELGFVTRHRFDAMVYDTTVAMQR